MIDAVNDGALTLEKLEAMTCVCLGNEMLDGWHLGKVRRKSPAGQVKVFQVLPDFPWPMVMKAQQVMVLLIGSPEGGVFFLECLAESRVIQLLRQAAGLLREPIAFDL